MRWARAAGSFAAKLAEGAKIADIKEAKPWSGGPRKVTIRSVFLTPIAVTRDNLDVVIDAGWASRGTVCSGVDRAKAPAACSK